MKNLLLFFFLCIAHVNLSAQSEWKGIFLFEKFMPGKIVYKTGTEKSALLNYNKVDEKMYFILQDPDSTLLELTQTSYIAEISIANRNFEHIKEGQFYEKINIDNNTLYIRWKSSIVSEGKSVGYGIKSSTGAVDNAARAFGHLTTQKLQSTESFKTNSHNVYYLKILNEFKRFDSFKSLGKLLKKQGKSAETYVKSENLDFKSVEDIKKAVAYYSQDSQ